MYFLNMNESTTIHPSFISCFCVHVCNIIFIFSIIQTPLHYAVLNNEVGMVNLLLKANADPNLVDSDGMCDMKHCCTSDEYSTVCTLFVMMHCQHCLNTAVHYSHINKYFHGLITPSCIHVCVILITLNADNIMLFLVFF